MKKMILSGIFVAAIALMAWNFYSSLHNEDLSELAKANIEALARPEKPTEPNFIGGDSGSGIWEEIKKENLTGTISRHENVKGATGRCEMKLMQNPESYNPYQYCLK